MFKELSVHTWRQFDRVDISFHPRLTILTGANGAGKTSLLHLLNRHWGWNIQYVSTPQMTKKGRRRLWSGFWSRDTSTTFDESDLPNALEIGSIKYRDHGESRLLVPTASAETFAIQISPQPALEGVYVPSHRPLYVHQPVDEIPTRIDAKRQLFDNYLTQIRSRWQINHRVKSPSHMLKRSLISLATFGYETEAINANLEARETFEGFQQVLRIILPRTLGFRRIRVRVPDVIFDTDTGEFSLDAVSGGVSALIDIAWQIFLYSKLADEFVVIIDEPEAHLHPELQQSVLPDLLKAFPKCQFVVASHNPFVVGSVRDSHVYVLAYDETRRVNSRRLEGVNKAGTANEILRDVLGMRSTTGLWVDRTLESALAAFAERGLSDVSLQRLKTDLAELGLSRYLPETLASAVDQGESR